MGPPAYVAGKGSRGWRIGKGGLTLLWGQRGNPANVEVTFVLATPAEAEALQQAFVTAGGKGPAPSDELLYAPIRYCARADPFGFDFLISSPLGEV